MAFIGYRITLNPTAVALQVLFDQLCKQSDVRWLTIQTGNILIALTTRLYEYLAIFHADFLQCFQAICAETGADNLHFPGALPDQTFA